MNSHVTIGGGNNPFAALSSIVLGEEPLPVILERVVHLAKEVIPAPVETSITLIGADGPETVGFSGEPAITLDERQYESERGPCLDAASSGNRILITDMTAESRWPQFAQAAVNSAVRSSLSVPLPVQREVTGALNFYATERDAFNDEAVSLAETFAGHAAVAVANARLLETTAALAEQMKEAMATRAVIEQAKGVVMGQRNCTADDAFDTLVRLSQESHVKLREVAQRLVDHVAQEEAERRAAGRGGA